MARRIGIFGLSNTGKSYSRTFIENGEECFIIAPSTKEPYLTKKNKEPVSGAALVNDKGQKLTDFIKISAYIKGVYDSGNSPMKLEGNYIVIQDINQVSYMLKYISDYMPHIKNVFLADFTHWISYILTTKQFRSRKAGGAAFERFWDLAADSLTNIILSIDYLREDLLVFTEYHVEYNSDTGVYDIFVPAGECIAPSFQIAGIS